jgi:ABC-type glycerol-3-phosphate transport system permease component
LLYTDDIVPVSLYLTRVTNYIEFLKYAQESGFTGIDLGNLEIPEDTLVYAIALVTTAPMLCIFVAFQKFFVRRLTSGAVKG